MSGNIVIKHKNNPRNIPSMFLSEKPSFFINTILLILTNINTINPIGNCRLYMALSWDADMPSV